MGGQLPPPVVNSHRHRANDLVRSDGTVGEPEDEVGLSGADHDERDHAGVPGVGGETTYALLGTSSVVSSTSFADVDDLTFSLEADAVYIVEYFLRLSTNGTSVGIKLALDAAEAGTSIALTGLIPSAPASLSTPFAAGFTFSKNAEIVMMTTGPGATNTFGMLVARVGTTVADTLRLRHASETATQTSILDGFSFARCTRVA